MVIEEETGPTPVRSHARHGYSASDSKDVPFTWTKLYPPCMTMPPWCRQDVPDPLRPWRAAQPEGIARERRTR